MASTTVHLTWFSDDGESVGVPANLESIRTWMPDAQVRVWSVEDVRTLMRDAGDHAVLEAFDALVPYAFKSDLASYYLLLRYGGWYTDLNNEFVAPAPDVTECTMYLFKDVHDEQAPWSIATCLLYAVAGSPALLRAIELVVDNCRRQAYGKSPLCVTGPTVFGSAIAQVGLIDTVTYHSGAFELAGSQKVLTTREGTLFARYKSNGLAHGDAGVAGGNNYNELWYSRGVYAR